MSPRITQPQQSGGPRDTARSWRFELWVFTYIVIATLSLGHAHAVDSPSTLEYRVKAGYLYNFAKYVEWPTTVLGDTNSPIVIGVIDNADAMPVIQQVLANKLVNEHPIIVKAVSTPNLAEGCHILFVSRTANQTSADVKAALGSAATLLVGEADQFAEDGGMIGFVREANTLRVTLNLESVSDAGLKVSSKLASVARTVKTKRIQKSP